MEISEIVAKLERERASTKFSFLLKVCQDRFGQPRISGSHHVFKTPWPGDPRINLQKDKSKAKPYQVDQVIEALERLAEKDGKEND